MSIKPVVYPYSMNSESARNLAGSLGALRVRENGNYRYKKNHLIINWGNPRLPQWITARAFGTFLNPPQGVIIASDKLKCLSRLRDLNFIKIPDWIASKEEAAAMLASPKFEGFKNAIVCRQLLRANSGRGVVLATRVEELVDAPLYTRYVPKVNEFRVHVGNHQIFDVQQKKKAADTDVDKYIRNHENGWVFCREDIEIPDSVKLASLEVVELLGLDFGAVDVGWHPECGVCVYEVNTAPGLVGTTLETYSGFFKSYLV